MYIYRGGEREKERKRERERERKRERERERESSHVIEMVGGLIHVIGNLGDHNIL